MRFNPMQFGSFAPQIHREGVLYKVPVNECASRTGLEVSFECDRCLFFCEGEVGDEKPRAKLGSVCGTAFVVGFKPLA